MNHKNASKDDYKKWLGEKDYQKKSITSYMSRVKSILNKVISSYNNGNKDEAIGIIDKEIDLNKENINKAIAEKTKEPGDVRSELKILKEYIESLPDTTTKHPLNLILYGPPGTGKTYNTVNKALDIVEPKWQDDFKKQDKITEEREYAQQRFNYHKDITGQIVFTTFHQSMGYEDFIEGIKPVVKDDKMTYKVQDGIFRKISEKAEKAKSCYWIDQFVQSVEGKNNSIELETNKQKKKFKVWHDKDSKSLSVQPDRSNSDQNIKISIDDHLKKPLSEIDLEKILEGDFGDVNNWETYTPAIIDRIIKTYKNKKDLGYPPYVLIIDEINRGNVAQIFGELITLIEPSKRLGNSEEMKAILPYSSAQKGNPVYFGVPNNVYIIGTMNTADRSVEALDTALRRRFSFEEMMPDKKPLEGKTVCNVGLDELLETINKRIVALKDREHQIGHSYFMGCPDDNAKAETWLTGVFKDKIIPLLQEYFYGDYKKIYYVLGPGFVEKETKKTIFAVDSNDYELDIPEERYDIVSFDAEFKIKDAIEKMKVQKQNGDVYTVTAAGAETETETDEASESEESTDKK